MTWGGHMIVKDIVIEKAKPEDAKALLGFLYIIGGETDNLTFGAEGLPISVEEEQDYLASLEVSISIATVPKSKAAEYGSICRKSNARQITSIIMPI